MPQPDRAQLMIVAGESSGERYAANLVSELRQLVPGVEAFGVGGSAMREAGVDVMCDVHDTAVVGLTEVLSRITFFRDLKRRLLAAATERDATVAVLIDFSGFNLRLAKALAARGMAVIWYVSPQVWAWRGYRARTLGRLAREILVVFPFEVEFYAKRGIAATFVGHPLVDVVAATGTRVDLCRELGLPADKPLLGVLPGSRPAELDRLLPVLVPACRKIQEASGASLLISRAPGLPAEVVSQLATLPNSAVLEGRTWDVLGHADLSLVASGTVTVEGALLSAPMVVMYRVAWLTHAIVSRMVTVKHAAMPNILLGEEVVPELIQSACTVEAVTREAVALLEDAARRERIKERLREIGPLLGSGNSARNAASRVAAAFGHGHVDGAD